MCHQNSGQCHLYASEGVWTWPISFNRSMKWTRSGEESGSVAAQGRSSLRSSCLVIFFGFKPTFRIPSSKRRVSEWEQYFCCKLWCSRVEVRAPTREYWCCASVTNLGTHASVTTGNVQSMSSDWSGQIFGGVDHHWQITQCIDILKPHTKLAVVTTLDWSHLSQVQGLLCMFTQNSGSFICNYPVHRQGWRPSVEHGLQK